MNYAMQFSFVPVLLISIVLFAACGASTPGNSDSGPVSLNSDAEKASYIIGFQIGQDFKSNSMNEIDPDLIARAIKDVLAGNKLAMEESEMGAFMQQYMMAQRAKILEKNGAEAKAYLEENKGKDGVVELPSGLQYKVITEGTGEIPESTDTVRVHYKGTLINGEQFDSSYDRGQPAEFPVTGVIKGWVEALQLMPTGSKWQLVIPPELAYGEQGNPSIPPNSLLIFEVELMAIVAAQ